MVEAVPGVLSDWMLRTVTALHLTITVNQPSRILRCCNSSTPQCHHMSKLELHFTPHAPMCYYCLLSCYLQYSCNIHACH